jgi:hypothetical protein
LKKNDTQVVSMFFAASKASEKVFSVAGITQQLQKESFQLLSLQLWSIGLALQSANKPIFLHDTLPAIRYHEEPHAYGLEAEVSFFSGLPHQ